MGTNDTNAANNQIIAIDPTAIRRVTHLPYLFGGIIDLLIIISRIHSANLPQWILDMNVTI